MDAKVKKELVSLLGRDRFWDGSSERVCYSYDASGKKHMPDGVAFPRSKQEISEILKLANTHLFPVIPRGSGSGMTGGSIPIHGGIVLSMTEFNRILEIDTENLVAVAEPGVVTADLQSAVKEMGLFYPPDPASLTFSTLGGNIAENAGGMRAVKYGVTKDYVLGLEVVLPNGDIISTGSKCVKDVVGYNLSQLLVGSEGTLGVVTKAILKLLPLPESIKTLSATFASVQDMGRAIAGILKGKIVPTTLEFMDKNALWSVQQYLHIGLPTGTEAYLLVEFDGPPEQIEKGVREAEEICFKNNALEVKTAVNEKEQNRLWEIRRAASASLAHHKPIKKLNEDIVVPRAKVKEMITAIDHIAGQLDLLIVNFGHAGDGNIHVNVLVKHEPVSKGEEAVKAVFDKTIELGGRISGEHGIGLSKKDFIIKNIGATALNLMQSIKRAVDPNNILNPGKIFP